MLIEIADSVLINPDFVEEVIRRGGYTDIFMGNRKSDALQELYGHYSIWDDGGELYNKLKNGYNEPGI